MAPGFRWLSPKLYTEMMPSYRRSIARLVERDKKANPN
jgi:hypothetical protein